jgi:integrase
MRPRKNSSSSITTTTALLLKGEAYCNFVESLPSEFSRRMYISILKRYMAFCKVVDINDLFFNANLKLIQDSIINYLLHLRDQKNLSPNTRKQHASAIKHLYEMNDITLNWKKINTFLGEKYKVTKDRPYEEIKKILDKCSERERVIVLLMCSSGRREGAIPGLRLRNLTKIEKYGLYLIVVYESAKEEYTTFCSPECARAIDNYLEYRQRYNELLKPESPLIRAQFNKLDPFECVRKVKPISRELIHWTIHKLLYDSGLRQKEAIEIESQSQWPRE